MMITFALPVESSNEAMRNGKLQKVFQQLAEDLKPEAGYFFPSGGERGGFLVVDMRESSQVAEIAELFLRAERQDRDEAGDERGRSAQGAGGTAGHHPTLRLIPNHPGFFVSSRSSSRAKSGTRLAGCAGGSTGRPLGNRPAGAVQSA
jgi:hypothetical protein